MNLAVSRPHLHRGAHNRKRGGSEKPRTPVVASLDTEPIGYRRGQRISTSFIESAVNQLIDKRMSKAQQMRWSRSGAHALLQVRAEVVDQRLGAVFARRYPGFVAANDSAPLAA